MMKNEKAAVGVASAYDSRRDHTSQQDLPRTKYTTRKAVVQVTEMFLFAGVKNTCPAGNEPERRVMEVQEDGKT